MDQSFREFLTKKVQFKEAVTINDPGIVYIIHLSYRLQFLRDTALARFNDDQMNHVISQLITSMHVLILDYIFGDEFERIQDELLTKMKDNVNVVEKQAALKFFLEICSLLKNVQLMNKHLQSCSSAFNKLMTVLAQIFDIMIPDKRTLRAEISGNKELLLEIYERRMQEETLERALNGDKAEGKDLLF